MEVIAHPWDNAISSITPIPTNVCEAQCPETFIAAVYIMT